MKSDLVAQLKMLGNSCNSSTSNMATPVDFHDRHVVTLATGLRPAATSEGQGRRIAQTTYDITRVGPLQ